MSHLLWLALLLPLTAGAGKLHQRVDNAQADVDRIVARTATVERQVVPGRGFMTEAQAIIRFQDAVYLHMTAEHELAAASFFALVTTGALSDAGLHRDAEWYLAESLFHMKNFTTAESRFKVIAEDDAHPFRDDAVRRLLEIYAARDDTEAFYTLYEREIVRGRVRPSDLITYTVAKSFHQQGETVKAKAYLLEIPPESPYYARSRYYLGAVMVADGALEDAVGYFEEVAGLSVETLMDREIHDLAKLALGRVHYELGNYEAASAWYGKISGDSQYLPDKLYETVWTFIKQEAYQDALKGVEIFLLAYPEHEYTAHLKVLEGHLHSARTEYDQALNSYEQVIADYTPIRERFDGLSQQEEVDSAYFENVAAMQRGERAQAVGGLPSYAFAMMAADEDLSRAIHVHQELETQETSLRESERLVDEISVALDNSEGLGGFQQLRWDASMARTLAVQARLHLLELEEEWLVDLSSGELKRQIQAHRVDRGELQDHAKQVESKWRGIEQDRDEVEREQARLQNELDQSSGEATEAQHRLQELHEKSRAASDEDKIALKEQIRETEDRIRELRRQIELSKSALSEVEGRASSLASRGDFERSWLDEVAALRAEYRNYRRQVKQTDPEVGRRLDHLHDALAQAVVSLDGSTSRIATIEEAELKRVRSRFEHEIAEVASERAELDRTAETVDEVSVELTRAGFSRLEDFFFTSVLKADLGIVDVYWAQKLDVADQKKGVKEEKLELLEDLDARFKLIRQKMID